MNAKIIYLIIQELWDRLINEEKREKTVLGIITCVSIIFLFFIFIYYIISSPLTMILSVLGVGADSETAQLLQNFKNEQYIKDKAMYEGRDIPFEQYIKDEAMYEGRDIPLFFQFDKRWANYPYAGTTIKIAGCGPTSLAMVVVGLTGDTNVTPLTMAKFSTENGWAIDGMGSSWELMTTGARKFGLSSEQVSTSALSIIENLSQGKVMITSMKPGTFTNGGHFIVLTGLTDDGMVKVNDSWSEKLSNMVFSPELISNESKGAWAFTLEVEKDE